MIFVDANEIMTGSKVHEILTHWGIPCTVRLAKDDEPHFDYIIHSDDNKLAIGIEHKEANDYLSSKNSGHLDRQLWELSHNLAFSFLVIVGDTRYECQKHSIPQASYISSLLGSSMKRAPDGLSGKIVTINDSSIQNDNDFALFLKLAQEKLNEGNFIRLPKLESFQPTGDDIAVAVLCQFTGVGEIRARAMLKKFGNLKTIFHQLEFGMPLEIAGIGQVTEFNMQEIYSHKYGAEE